MWVKLLAGKNIEIRGKPTSFHAGDWVDVGKHQALAWVENGEAVIANTSLGDIVVTGCGVVVRGNHEAGAAQLEKFKAEIDIWHGEPWLNFEHSLVWETSCPLRAELISVGFDILQRWDIAVPFTDYKVLAKDIGDEDERELTQSVIRDLRVPVYDTRLIFVKRNASTKKLFDMWQEDLIAERNEQLSFLRALYTVKPLILALPVTWVNQKYEA